MVFFFFLFSAGCISFFILPVNDFPTSFTFFQVKAENPADSEDPLNENGINSSLFNDSSNVNSCSIPVAVKEVLPLYKGFL